MPPTSSTSLISAGFTPASFMQSLQGCCVRLNKSLTKLSNLSTIEKIYIMCRIGGQMVRSLHHALVNCATSSPHILFSHIHIVSRSVTSWLSGLQIIMRCSTLASLHQRSLSVHDKDCKYHKKNMHAYMTKTVDTTKKTCMHT